MNSSQQETEYGDYEVLSRELALRLTRSSERRRLFSSYQPGRVMLWFEEINAGVVFKPTPLEWYFEATGSQEAVESTMTPITDDRLPQIHQALVELNGQIDSCYLKKELAVADGDFASAVSLRGQIEELQEMGRKLEQEWHREN